ncbi:MAG: peroxidase-related enzyme [Actinomycetota bacterium]
MSYLETITDEDAEGEAAELFAHDRAADGYVHNYTRTFARRPDVYRAWNALADAIAGGDESHLRRYELATLGAARQLRSSYCMLAHGRKVADDLWPADVVTAIAEDPDTADLTDRERAIVAFAEVVASGGINVTEADHQSLRDVGLTDAEIFDVVLTAAARCFFSTVLDATGTLPDAAYADAMPAALRDALVVGRPIAGT